MASSSLGMLVPWTAKYNFIFYEKGEGGVIKAKEVLVFEMFSPPIKN